MITFFLDFYDQLYNFFSSANTNLAVLIVKLVSYLISMMLAILTGILLMKSDAGWWMREASMASNFAYGSKEDQKWQKILKRLKKGDEANLKLAVIEANNLFDDILKRMGLPGQDMGERLKQFEKQELASIDLVWEAHRLRNAIVHEPGTHISYEQAETAVSGFEAALKELEYL